jgi:glycosyltransferase involved in cell wall biosynthesis
MPKVSIAIPAYNAMDYLPETLESVLAQTFTDFEVLVVNDGSTDRTAEWVSQLTDPRVKLISQTNQGLAAARNTGIAHARGEYIAFLDADDLWEPTKLEKQVRVLEENPEVGLVYTWMALINETGESTGRVFQNHAEGNIWEKLIESNIVGCGSVAMVRRSCFETLGGFDQNLRSFVEDWDMWLRIAFYHPFKVVKEPLVYYRQRSTSASNNWEAMEQSSRIVLEKAFASAPPDLLALKKRSYGLTNLYLAWKPLQSKNQDYEKASYFCQQALAHYPQLRFSKQYLRLSLTIALMRWIKPAGYRRLRALVYALRRRTVAIGR